MLRELIPSILSMAFPVTMTATEAQEYDLTCPGFSEDEYMASSAKEKLDKIWEYATEDTTLAKRR